MAGKYRAYPEYKNSGVEWLGPIPIHWDCVRLKHTAELAGLKVDAGADEQYVGMENVESQSGKYIATEDVIPEGVSASFKKGDVLFGKLRPYLAKSWLADFSGICSSEFLVLRSKKVSPKFLNYFTLTEEFIKQVDSSTYGSKMPRASWDFIGWLHVPVPADESTKIANFLDHETAKTDTLIEKQQQLIKLLQEKRQAVISHAVTKGLNPNAPMRDSGVEWLGEVPEHWGVMSLGKITLSKCDGPFGSGLKSEHYSEGGVRVIRLQNIKIGSYHEGEGAFIDEVYYKNNLSDHDVLPDDVLIAGLGDPNNPVGRACVAPPGISPAMVKADCFRFRLDKTKVVPAFIAAQLSVSSWVDAGRLSNGSTRARIPLSLMATRKIAICPLKEQLKILGQIKVLSEKYDRIEQRASAAIELLIERRTALISAAVTGKIDVRDWQPPQRARAEEVAEVA